MYARIPLSVITAIFVATTTTATTAVANGVGGADAAASEEDPVRRGNTRGAATEQRKIQKIGEILPSSSDGADAADLNQKVIRIGAV